MTGEVENLSDTKSFGIHESDNLSLRKKAPLIRSVAYVGTGSPTWVAQLFLAPFTPTNYPLVKEKKQLFPSWGQCTTLAWTRNCARKGSPTVQADGSGSILSIGYGTSIFQRLLMSNETAAL